MALADRHLARDPGLSERPAGGVAARRRDRPGLRPGPGRRREGQPPAAWLAAAHCPIVTRTGSAGPGLPDSGGQPCVSKGLRNFVVCQKLSYIIMQGPARRVLQTRSYYPALVHWRCHASDSWQKSSCLGHNLMLPPYELESLGEMQKSMRKLEMSRNLKRKTSDDTN